MDPTPGQSGHQMFDRGDTHTAFILEARIQRLLHNKIPTGWNHRVHRDHIGAPKDNAVPCRRRTQNDLGRTTMMNEMSGKADKL